MQGLERAAFLGMPRVQLKTDAATLGRALVSTDLDQSSIWVLIRRIREFVHADFISCIVSVCPRTCNRVADGLGAHGVSAVPICDRVYWCQAPSFVTQLVSSDLFGEWLMKATNSKNESRGGATFMAWCHRIPMFFAPALTVTYSPCNFTIHDTNSPSFGASVGL
jgi:hypothetical protein